MTIATEPEQAEHERRREGETSCRLLAAADLGVGPDLEAHQAVHGAFDIPSHHSSQWGQRLLAQLHVSGLTGRGGAGFPAARKMELLARQHRRPLLVVNAMEGEPASLKDRVLVTRSPHLVLDGALATAAAASASEIVVCVPDDRPDIAAALERAVHERARARLAGVQLSVMEAPSRYAAGEESALVDWVAGGRGLPSYRPDKSVPLTVRRSPVLLHNAETMANVALVARHGGEWFRRRGTDESPGTTLVTVSGAVPPGVIEVDLGTPLRAVLARAGMTAVPEGLLVGGYGGSWIGPGDLDVAFAPGALQALGATVGAGVLAVLPQGTCGLAETARIAAYLAGESAGQCGPCVYGLPAIADDLVRLVSGYVDPALEDRLWRRMAMVEGRGACRLPDGAVRLVRSALTVFGADVHRHLQRRPCDGWNRPPVLPVPVRRP